MGKLIATINMTIDGYCDHTAIIPDEEIHNHFSDVLRDADAILYGRITYQLMEFWPTILNNPTGDKSMDDFAVAIDETPKIVFSRTLKSVEWKSARLAKRDIKEEVLELKQSHNGNKNIYAGSPSMIVQLTQLGLIDEYQLVIHPVVAGSGLPLFKNINDTINLKLLKTKTFTGGAVAHYYEPV